MFFRDLKPKTDVTLDVALARVHLPVRLGHRDARKSFAEPLARQLAAAGLGVVTECTAHGSAPADVFGVDLHLGLTRADRATLETVARMLEHLAAPCGSSIRLAEGGQPLVFGASEGLELSLEADAAPTAEARRGIARTCADALREDGVFRGWVERGGKTVFFFYGQDFTRMRARLAEALSGNPQFRSALTRRMA